MCSEKFRPASIALNIYGGYVRLQSLNQERSFRTVWETLSQRYSNEVECRNDKVILLSIWQCFFSQCIHGLLPAPTPPHASRIIGVLLLQICPTPGVSHNRHCWGHRKSRWNENCEKYISQRRRTFFRLARVCPKCSPLHASYFFFFGDPRYPRINARTGEIGSKLISNPAIRVGESEYNTCWLHFKTY